jgi:rare lipoprotein A
MNKHRNALLIALACCVGNSAWAAHHAHHPAHSAKQAKQAKQHQARVDRSGKPRKGMASYYNGKGRRMADGTRFDPHAKTAASKTLPLGTKARVTNLETGKSETVEVRDRGPYVRGRIVDVTPRVAQDLEMKKDGVAPVEVKPVQLPPPDDEREAAR